MKFKGLVPTFNYEQRQRCQSLNPYEDWPLFKSIEEAFVKEFGEQPGVAKVFCGFGSGLGPINAITVSIKKGYIMKPTAEIFHGVSGRARFF